MDKIITVAELREELLKFDPNMPVLHSDHGDSNAWPITLDMGFVYEVFGDGEGRTFDYDYEYKDHKPGEKPGSFKAVLL